MSSNSQIVQGLRWQKFPVLDDGFVCLVDAMGDDAAVVAAARVSYGQDQREPGTQGVEDESSKHRGLIRYMMAHHHGTPFEMSQVKFLVRVPMDCWRQWIRHRMFSVNEYSTRYSEAIDSQQKTPPNEWRLQSTANKQGSEGFLPGGVSGSVHRGDVLTTLEAEFHEAASKLYKQRLDDGVAREQARKDLPLSTYTEAYWNGDLRNIFQFLYLRMDGHAQKEIRDYATVIGEQIIAPLFPLCWEAFCDFQLNAMTLSAQEITMISRLCLGAPLSELKSYADVEFTNKREREVAIAKLVKLGLSAGD